jgi:predicted GTPase
MLLAYRKHLHLGKLIPAMGYYKEQIADLEASINAVPCDAVIIATPMDLRKVVRIDRPATTVSYAVEDREAPYLREVVDSLESKRA